MPLSAAAMEPAEATDAPCANQAGWPDANDTTSNNNNECTTKATTACGQNAPQGRALAQHAQLERNRHGWRYVVLNFTPSWFSVNMGTGIASILLHNLPYNARWLYWISVAVFALNVVLFLLFFTISVLRYTLFRGVWVSMIHHPVQSLFLGTFPMGLATIVNMIVFVCVPAWGDKFATLAWALWWIDVVCAVGTNFYLPFIIMYKHQVSELSTLPPVKNMHACNSSLTFNNRLNCRQ